MHIYKIGKYPKNKLITQQTRLIFSLTRKIYRVVIAAYFSFWLFEAISSNLISQKATVSFFFFKKK